MRIQNSSLPTWQKINYNSKVPPVLERIVKTILSEKLERTKYNMNRPIPGRVFRSQPIGKLRKKPEPAIIKQKIGQIVEDLDPTITEDTEIFILDDDEFTNLFEELEKIN